MNAQNGTTTTPQPTQAQRDVDQLWAKLEAKDLIPDGYGIRKRENKRRPSSLSPLSSPSFVWMLVSVAPTAAWSMSGVLSMDTVSDYSWNVGKQSACTRRPRRRVRMLGTPRQMPRHLNILVGGVLADVSIHITVEQASIGHALDRFNILRVEDSRWIKPNAACRRRCQCWRSMPFNSMERHPSAQTTRKQYLATVPLAGARNGVGLVPNFLHRARSTYDVFACLPARLASGFMRFRCSFAHVGARVDLLARCPMPPDDPELCAPMASVTHTHPCNTKPRKDPTASTFKSGAVIIHGEQYTSTATVDPAASLSLAPTRESLTTQHRPITATKSLTTTQATALPFSLLPAAAIASSPTPPSANVQFRPPPATPSARSRAVHGHRTASSEPAWTHVNSAPPGTRLNRQPNHAWCRPQCAPLRHRATISSNQPQHTEYSKPTATHLAKPPLLLDMAVDVSPPILVFCDVQPPRPKLTLVDPSPIHMSHKDVRLDSAVIHEKRTSGIVFVIFLVSTYIWPITNGDILESLGVMHLKISKDYTYLLCPT
ncbi:hypothetical protein L227DRAFT_565476 [Lentinus tigrinus ALCF2SS1-6]|uniref:Uncharacterized protein n=1 Tax=Lentinus tigrinus ALCF2SS1-6 TaxID=1328759 RepID=A0A5C2S3P0_9APHY|nr:hypothetical protein L227DRAFT_565476 [Lentinus tigrinus ALCF2SS1-6]